MASDQTAVASERRYLSIVFVDLVGYTELSGLLDPEDLRVLQHRYHNLVLQVMERFGGFVAKFIGDGALVYFGYPTAHENDAERAVRASLELLERFPSLDTNLGDVTMPPLAARIGVHSGLVLIAPEMSSGGSVERGAVGEVVNVAARLQSEAQPNSLVVSEDTLDLLGNQFEYTPMQLRALKGVPRDIGLYQVSGARPGAPRSGATRHRGAPRMVGREAALARIRKRWDEVREDRRCRTVVVVGDAGIGKTRLVRELCATPELAEATILQVPCHELFASTPFYPIASFLWARTGLAVADGPAERAAKIATFLESLGLNTEENRQLVVNLLGLATGATTEAIASTPQMLKLKQGAFVLAALRRSAESLPIILWVEDTHWVDASSAELLREAAAELADMPILILITTRSFPRGPALPEADELVGLEQLHRADCVEIARAIPGAEALNEDTIARAVEAAGGVPLFVEQLVISLVDERSRPSSETTRPRGIPLPLTEMMSERLDRRPGTRRIVQAAACIGRSFTPSFLATLLQQEPQLLSSPLESLVDAELLFARRHGPEILYEFRHALLQRLAHESILQAERRAIHARIVSVLRAADGTRPTLPEVIAHHLTEAGQTVEAIGAWLQAAVGASQRSAHMEAIEHVLRGLELVVKLPNTADGRRLELNLRAVLVGSLIATEGATSDRVSECCRRGIELCQDGEPLPLFLAFAFGQFTFTNCRGHIDEAKAMARLFLARTEAVGSAPGRAVSHRMLGNLLFGQGEAATALAHFEASLRLCENEPDVATTQMFGQNSEVHTKSAFSLLLLVSGEVDRALAMGVGALRSADDLRHPHSMAIPLSYVGCWVFGLCGAAEQMARAAERLIALSDQHRLGMFRTLGIGQLGWARLHQGELSQAADALEHAVTTLDAIKWRLGLSGFLGCLADARRRLGQFAVAQDICRRALDVAPESSAKWFEPELMRIEALIAYDRHPGWPEPAIARLWEAAGHARSLGFPVLERRCLLSLRHCIGPASANTQAGERLRQLAHLDGLAQRVVVALGDYLS
jgi:class 3 adenylate cyclase/predicted ATPase